MENNDMSNIRVFTIIGEAESSQQIEQHLHGESSYTLMGQVKIGFEGIERCKVISPDVVIVDRGVGDVDSLEVLRQLKDINSAIAYVMISFTLELDWMREAVLLGVDNFVPKPIDKATLIHAINHAYNSLET